MRIKSKETLLTELQLFDVQSYAVSRNFIDGSVSKLSPYLTHGIITIKECVEIIVRGSSIKDAEKFLMELVRKEFFLQVQKNFGNSFIDKAIWEDKTAIEKKSLLPLSLLAGRTNTSRIDMSTNELVQEGRLHNHKRMRLASRCCHWAKLDWKKCADRTYYHFLDGELSANHLSRQRVNSTFANKAYFMNEDNLQKYRPGTIDKNLQGTYETVYQRLFDTERVSTFRTEEDQFSELKTPTELLQSRNKDMYYGSAKIRILTPWKLEENLLKDAIPTIILLDSDFTKNHPRSKQRLLFIQKYCDKYEIPFLLGSYKEVIQRYLDQKSAIILDERHDPFYSGTQKIYSTISGVEIIAYDRINTNQSTEPIMKFFKYRNKTLPFIKKMILQ